MKGHSKHLHVSAAVGIEAAFIKLQPIVGKIPVETLETCCMEPLLVVENVRTGVESILAADPAVLAKLSFLMSKKELEETVDVARALSFAAARVGNEKGNGSAIAALLDRARPVRKLLLAAAETAVLAGLVPEDEVATIRAGSGQTDEASDCVQLVALFRKHEKVLDGKTVVEASHLDEAATVGNALLELIKPSGARPRDKIRLLALERDRFYTHLVARWDVVRRIGAVLFGVDELNAKVPPLGSHARRSSAAEEESEESTTEAPPGSITVDP